ncbi:hypothetical protein [Streptomyces sp. NPDC058108]|uniref:hypothetical protein n=1 Tax=Streptomyces sp. NPDC058108 TaxID=3346344 RepID=UPI0036EAD6BF
MTGPEHYLEAQRLLGEAAANGAEGTYFVRPENLAAAQAHATLALAAASALPTGGAGASSRQEWVRAIHGLGENYDPLNNIH